MVISICGDNEYKNMLINKLKALYRNSIVICDYFQIKFNSIIDTEKYKYELLDSLRSLESARIEYAKIIEKTANRRIDKFLDENKDKIVLLITDNVLNREFYKSICFKDSDIKILASSKNIININYYNDIFDYILDDFDNIDIRKLVNK